MHTIMGNDFEHKYPGWIPAKLEDLCIGDTFGISEYLFSCTYMGIFKYSGKGYFVFKVLNEPHICEYSEMKDKILLVRK